MAVSIYYSAKRENAMTDKEREKVSDIVKKYCSEYPFGEKSEDFYIYSQPDEAEEIFSGSTALPYGDPLFMYDVAEYWLSCLTEITRTLSGCKWHVHCDDDELAWNAQEGWHFRNQL